jgi:hypothetical protein
MVGLRADHPRLMLLAARLGSAKEVVDGRDKRDHDDEV